MYRSNLHKSLMNILIFEQIMYKTNMYELSQKHYTRFMHRIVLYVQKLKTVSRSIDFARFNYAQKYVWDKP